MSTVRPHTGCLVACCLQQWVGACHMRMRLARGACPVLIWVQLPQDAIGEDFLQPYGEFLQRGAGLPGRTADKYVKYSVRPCAILIVTRSVSDALQDASLQQIRPEIMAVVCISMTEAYVQADRRMAWGRVLAMLTMYA